MEIWHSKALTLRAPASLKCFEKGSDFRYADSTVALSRQSVGLGRVSVVNVSQIVALDKSILTERVGRLSVHKLCEAEDGIRVALAL